jgi:DNA invertase Pin-like site-specific DNA recombinase
MQRSTTYLAYGRVSTGEQGAGLEVQRAALAAWAERRDVELDYVQDEGYTGGNANRPALDACRARLAHPAGPAGLVVAKLDRLSRSLLDFSTLVAEAQKQGWRLVCLDPDLDLGTPTGRLMANVLMTFAQFEREMISQRTKAVLAYKKSQGIHCGRHSTLDPDTRRRILGDKALGLSNGAIARGLNEDSVPTGPRRQALARLDGALNRHAGVLGGRRLADQHTPQSSLDRPSCRSSRPR